MKTKLQKIADARKMIPTLEKRLRNWRGITCVSDGFGPVRRTSYADGEWTFCVEVVRETTIDSTYSIFFNSKRIKTFQGVLTKLYPGDTMRYRYSITVNL